MMSYLIFDWGGTSVKHAVWDGRVLSQHGYFKTPATWTAMKEAMNAVVRDSTHEFQGIAISSPGSVDVQRGVVGGISAIPYIHHFEIVKELEGLFHLPVSIENDANCAALAEVWQGVAKDEKDVLFVVVGTGIGGAVILDGKLKRGSQRFAGEFGCMILDGHETFSMLATPVHMAERYCNRKGYASDAISGEEVFALAKTDALAMEEVSNFYDYLALGLYNLQFTLDPTCIVLGGGVSQYPNLIPELTQRVNRYLHDAQIKDVVINLKACAFHNHANLMGAVAAHRIQCGGTDHELRG